MKKSAIAVIASLFLFTSCGKNTDHNGATHTHEDGTTHADHSADTTQEEFNAADTLQHEHESTEHGHSHD